MTDKMDAATATMIKNLEGKTGMPLSRWLTIVKEMGPLKHGEVVSALEARHGLTHGYANLVAHSAGGVLSEGAAEGEDLVASQYSGEKAALKPLYDRLIDAVQGFGGDVEIAPQKAYVSFRRSKQFAIFQPSTKARPDVGINLKGVPPTVRLEASGSFNSMVSHRVRVEQSSDVNAELIGWLREAYLKS